MNEDPHRLCLYWSPYIACLKPETTVIDVRKLRDTQVPDVNGQTIPAGETRGQVQWSLTGGVDRVLIGRSEQVDLVRGISSNYACQNCCPNNFYDGWLTPAQSTAFEGDQFQFIAMQQDMNCYGQVYPAYQVGTPSFTSSDLSICNPDWNTGTTTGVGPGEAIINGVWTGDAWLSSPTGVCDYDPIEVLREAACNVLCKVPTNFHQVGQGTNNGGVLHFSYVWESNTGNLADLSQCTVGEIVTYPGTNSPYVWERPPFTRSSPNPTVIDLPATSGGFDDDHLGPPFVTPFTTSSFFATQFYRYKCPCSNGGDYVNLTGSISIVRSVNQNPDGSWKYTVTKSGSSATINPITP